MIRHSVLASLVALVLSAAPAGAELGPKRASDIVHAFASGATACPFGSQGTALFDVRALPGGGTATLAVPPKRVLVVRRMDVGTSGGTPGATALVSFVAGVPGSEALYATRTLTLDASGAGRLQIEFPVGVVVASGGSVCASNTGSLDFGGTIEGFFAPAK